MDIDLDNGRLVVFLAGIFFWLGLEQIFSVRAATTSLTRRMLLHVSISALNTFLIRLLIYVPLLAWIVHVEQMGWGISRWLGLQGWSEILLSILVLDAFDYFWHRANHRVSFLWRFHKTHHADNDLDVFTALRFHPGELIISSGMKAIWILVWGPSAIAWFLFEVCVSTCAQMHHSNVDLPDYLENRLSRALVTPRFHALHHLVDRKYGDNNFSTIFSFWDQLFGSRAAHLTAEEMKNIPLGLPEDREMTLSVFQLLLDPFKTRNLHLDSVSRDESSVN